jgi:hypothetical protein
VITHDGLVDDIFLWIFQIYASVIETNLSFESSLERLTADIAALKEKVHEAHVRLSTTQAAQQDILSVQPYYKTTQIYIYI